MLFLFDHRPLLLKLLIYFYITTNETIQTCSLVIFISLGFVHALGMNIREFDDLGVQATTGWRELCGLETSKIYT